MLEMSDCEQTTFFISSVVRGYHAYKDIWQPDVGEELRCQRAVGNLVDAFAVAVMSTGGTEDDSGPSGCGRESTGQR